MSRTFPLRIRDHIGDPGKKRLYNKAHFSAAACRYDIATRAMSLGRDAAWKRALVAALPDAPAPLCVDLACGPGDVALLLARRYPRGRVVGVDIAAPMLAAAAARAKGAGRISFLRGDLGATGLADGCADIVTGSYALRNAPDLSAALREVRRILKGGGTAAFLDFANPASPALRLGRYLLLRGWCGLWGLLLHGSSEIHGYIAESLRDFPDRGALRARVRGAGFEIVASRRFFAGILEMLVLRKPRERDILSI